MIEENGIKEKPLFCCDEPMELKAVFEKSIQLTSFVVFYFQCSTCGEIRKGEKW